MKKTLLLLFLMIFGLCIFAQETEFKVKTDTVTVWESDILSEAGFENFDTVYNNPEGSPDEFELTKWFVTDTTDYMQANIEAVRTYYQYKVNSQGLRQRRTIVIKHTPKQVIEKHFTSD